MLAMQNHCFYCPYCGESIEVLIDCSVSSQSYIEDCEVCCRPMQLEVTVDDGGEICLVANHENE